MYPFSTLWIQNHLNPRLHPMDSKSFESPTHLSLSSAMALPYLSALISGEREGAVAAVPTTMAAAGITAPPPLGATSSGSETPGCGGS
jgi:hypothetical protein